MERTLTRFRPRLLGPAFTLALAAGLLLGPVATPAAAQGWFDACSYEADREVTLPASVTDTLDLQTGPGSLRVEGRPGLTEVRALGRACASDEDDLDDLQVTVERVGDTIRVRTSDPRFGPNWFGRGMARIDLVVEVPERMPVNLDDGSGSIEVERTGALRIEDGSGSLEVRDIHGSVTIDDGSGSVRVDRVSGDVRIEDGSGSVEVRGVEGTVRLRDGSGSIEVEQVDRDVIVERDGSGSIDVRDVLGSLTVERDGSGSIVHRDVGGSVDIPRRR